MASVNCKVRGHDPAGQQILWDGHSYVSTCGRCGEAIKRIGERRWIKVNNGI